MSLSRNPRAPALSAPWDVLVEVEGGDDHDRQGVGDVGTGESSGGLDAVHQRHPDVEQADVGTQPERQAHGLAPVGGRADHLDAGLGIEQHRQPAADDGLVVGDQDPDGHRAVPVRGRTASTRQPCSPAGPAWKVPPSSEARSRMPTRP